MIRLNVGCGPDLWGDVRVDLNVETLLGLSFRPDVLADAQNLPFKDAGFGELRASHVIEHLPAPATALKDWMRVCSGRLEVKFPLDDGFKRALVYGLTLLSWSMILHAFETRRRRAHLWIVTPYFVASIAASGGRTCRHRIRKIPLAYGRKGRLLKLSLAYEHIVEILPVSGVVTV